MANVPFFRVILPISGNLREDSSACPVSLTSRNASCGTYLDTCNLTIKLGLVLRRNPSLVIVPATKGVHRGITWDEIHEDEGSTNSIIESILVSENLGNWDTKPFTDHRRSVNFVEKPFR
jgi:hypothetical protein